MKKSAKSSRPMPTHRLALTPDTFARSESEVVNDMITSTTP